MKAALRALAPLAALSALLVAGCAQDVGDIVRVQPNFVKKSDFDGQWYIRNTIVEVPYHVAFGFEGQTLNTEKICWEITEDHLIGYRSYELLPGKSTEVDQEGKEIGYTPPSNPDSEYRNGDCYHDAPVVAYRIQSHFDIQRQYNPATGEQTNVIVENGSDRPWFQRQFMRVDWSKNQVTNFTADVNWQFDLTQYVEANEEGEWAFKMETAPGEEIELDPDEPGVFQKLFSDSRVAPNYIDVTRRVFVKPPTINYRGYAYPACYFLQYQTLDCNAGEVKIRTSMLKVPEKRTFEPRVYGDGRMNKFGYFRTERLAWDSQYGHTDSGRIQLANIHNIWETAYDEQGNVIPEAQRTPKPIVYALNPDFPEDLIPEAEEMAKGWSKAFTRAVAAAQNKYPEDIASQFPYEDAQGNYVNQGLFRLDYNEDGHATVGDLRYNFLTMVQEPLFRGSLLGYGPASTDPETGEILAGMAHVYQSAIDWYARRSLDAVRAINGDLPVSVENFSEGTYVSDWLEANRDRVDPRARLESLGRLDLLNKPLESLELDNVAPEAALRIEAFRQFGLDEVRENLEDRLSRVEGTSVEKLLVNEEVRSALANMYGDADLADGALDQQTLELARPLTLGGMDLLEAQQLRADWAAENSIWLAEFSDSAILGLAEWLAKQNWTEEQMLQFVRKRVFQAVAEHEVGHTIGLRHNFQGSFDAINFFDEYWEMRQENIAPMSSMQSINDILAMTEQTPSQITGRMREYQYSSIMDYGGRFNADFHGLGKYDEAAILFGYADFVEVFESTGAQFRNRYLETRWDGKPRFENQQTLAYPSFLEATHYTQVPFLMGDGDKAEGLRRLQQRKIISYEEMEQLRADGRTDRYVEVPYMFCSDEWAGAKISCDRHDQGADLWELTQTVTEGWLNYYWFNNFRRDRATWNPVSTAQRSLGSFARINNFYIHWVFDLIQDNYDDTEAGYLTGLYNQLAVMEGLNFLTGVAKTSPYGSFMLNEQENRYEYVWDGELEDADLLVEPGVGRRPYTRYDYLDGGYYYWQYPQEASHYWDYLAVMISLANSQGTFRGVDTQSDFSSFVLPYYMLFSEDLTTLFNGIITENPAEYAPRVMQAPGGAMTVVDMPTLDYLGILDQEVRDAPYVDPYMNWTKRIYALLYSMAGFTSQWSIDYADEHRIVRLGGGETLTPSEGWEVVTFEDDQGGMTYASLRDLGAERETAAETLINKANDLKAARKAAELRAENLELTQAERDAAADEAQDLMYEIESLVDWMELERTFGRIYNSVL